MTTVDQPADQDIQEHQRDDEEAALPVLSAQPVDVAAEAAREELLRQQGEELTRKREERQELQQQVVALCQQNRGVVVEVLDADDDSKESEDSISGCLELKDSVQALLSRNRCRTFITILGLLAIAVIVVSVGGFQAGGSKNPRFLSTPAVANPPTLQPSSSVVTKTPFPTLVGGDSWKQLGQDLGGEAAGDSFGRSVALSADGTVLAAGSEENDGNGISSGHVRVYSYNKSSNRWTRLGQDIDGEAKGDEFGRTVALSVDGFMLAAGSRYNKGMGVAAGHVRPNSNSGN